MLNQEYQITEIVNTDSYKISARAASTTIKSITVDGQISASAVTANGSDTGNGGSSVVGKYQINTGLTNVVTGTGWGAGTWSGGTWGTASTLTVVNTLRIWTQDNFGEDLLSCVRDGGIFFWDTSTDSLGVDRVTALASLTNADAETPTIAKQVLVSQIEDRSCDCFWLRRETSIGTQDPLLIRFSSQESLTTWKTETTNTAGELGLVRLRDYHARRNQIVFRAKYAGYWTTVSAEAVPRFRHLGGGRAPFQPSCRLTSVGQASVYLAFTNETPEPLWHPYPTRPNAVTAEALMTRLP